VNRNGRTRTHGAGKYWATQFHGQNFAGVALNVHARWVTRPCTRKDYALRRRFAFIDLQPRFDDPKFDAALAEKSVSEAIRKNIKNRIKDLNSRISSDKRNLGHGFEIGYSFFCPRDPVQDEEQWLRSVIKYEIKPLLMEYWFDEQDKATREINRLLGEGCIALKLFRRKSGEPSQVLCRRIPLE
jgi:hypothetical protein